MIRNCFKSLLFIGWIFSTSCANKVAPTGGIKDNTPPLLLVSSPENNSVNFSGRQIILSFDEYIQLKELNTQLVISPPISPKPQIQVRKKSVIIDFEESLKENTTYTINFGNAIVDTHEDNPLPGFRYVFSTGNEIDSLSISGSTKDALTKKPITKATVILYQSNVNDTSILKGPPDYFTRSDESGNFTLQNLKAGKYRLYAIEEENNNYLLDGEKEKIGFSTELVDVESEVNHNILLFNQYPDKVSIKESKQPLPGKLITVFNRPVINPTFLFAGDSLINIQTVYNDNKDTIIMYGIYSGSTPEAISMIWFENNNVIDTAIYSLPRKANITATENKTTGYNIYPSNGNSLSSGTNPQIQFELPLTKWDFTKMQLIKDSIEVVAEYTIEDSIKSKLIVSYVWTKGNYKIIVLPGAVTDMNGNMNDSITTTFFIPDEATKGTISYKIIPQFTSEYFLQLVNDKDEVIRQASKNELNTGTFNLLNPGTYFLRVIKDDNKNLMWDRGDYRVNLLPEQVIYFNNPVSVRANWEVEVDWERNK